MAEQIGYFGTLKNIAGKIFTFSKTITLTSPDDTSIITLPAGTKTIPPTTDTIKGDGTEGRVLRALTVTIDNGTNATTLKCSTASVIGWNGDVNAAEDNLGWGESTGVFGLGAAGTELIIGNAGITGDLVSVLMASVRRNNCGTALTAVVGNAGGGGGIDLYARNAASGGLLVWTTLVDTGSVIIDILYVTNA